MKHKILIVDNNPVIRKMLGSALEKEGYEVLSAEDGLSAFDILQRFTPDIIFLDLVMPNINGEQLSKIIADREDLIDTRIVVISGVAVESRGECEIRGVDACIAKGPHLTRHVVEMASKLTRESYQPTGQSIYGTEEVFPREISMELLAANRHLKVVLNNMSEGIVELAPDCRIIFANPAAAFLADMNEESLLATDFSKLFDYHDRNRVRTILAGLDRTPHLVSDDEPLTFNGLKVAINFLPVHDREHRTVIAIIQDVHERKIAETQLKETQKYLHSIVESIQAGIVVIDVETCRIIDANPRALDIFGTRKNELIGHPCHEIICSESPGKCPIIDVGKATHQGTQTLVNSKNVQIHILKTATACLINGKKCIVESFLDVTEQKNMERKLHSLSITDDLTGLLNRRGFFMMAKKQLQIADRNKGSLYLIFADVDNLKWVNDSFGHEIGDKVLKNAATILSSFRSSDIVGRLGGDEFAVLLSDSASEGSEQKLTVRFRELLSRGNEKSDLEIPLEISFGIVTYDPDHPCEIEELIAQADQRMYIAKKEKKSLPRPAV